MNSFCHEHPWVLCSLVFILGSCLGSFLNVLALRSLKEESLIWPGSYCPECEHSLAAWDNIPVISFFILGGKCRYCAKPISFQYPLVEMATGLACAALTYVFLVKTIYLYGFWAASALTPGAGQTHDLFAAIQHGARLLHSMAGSTAPLPTLDLDSLVFYKYGLWLGLIALACTLIAVTITDFREKLIPHEITYPSMIIGIAFSALVRGDLLGAMAGIGASYIIFDFLAFYGLKIYMITHKTDTVDDAQPSGTVEAGQEPEAEADAPVPAQEEPVEVMGGGDAVLSAVMSAYLGWQALVLALVVGFLAGTVMGLALLVVEMKKAGLLKECGHKSLKWALICGLIIAIVMGCIPFAVSGLDDSSAGLSLSNALGPALYGGAMGAAAGALIGMVRVGTKVSKPFPFGPALALGGFVAMFLIPGWLPFYSGQ